MITKWFVLSVVFSFVGDLDVWSDQSWMCDWSDESCVIRSKSDRMCDHWSTLVNFQLDKGASSAEEALFCLFAVAHIFISTLNRHFFSFHFFLMISVSATHIVKFLAQLNFFGKILFSWKMLMIPLRTFNLPVNEGHKFQGL